MTEPTKVKHLYRVIDDRAGVRRPPLLAVSIHLGVVPRRQITDDEPRADDLSAYKVCDRGDLVLNRMRAFQGAIGVSPSAGLVSPDYLVLRPLPTCDPRYLHHLFRSRWFVGEMVSRLRGIGGTETGSVRTPRINAEDLGEIEVRLPQLDSQRLIADFLDVESVRTDTLVAKKRRLIELLFERQKSAISLHLPSEPAVPLRRVADLLPGYTFPSDWFSPEGGGRRLLRGVNVGVGELRWAETVRLIDDHPELRRYQLRVDDVVIGMDRPFIGGGTRVALVDDASERSLLVQRVCRVRAFSPAWAVVLRFVLASDRFVAHVEPDLTGVSVPHLSESQIGGVPVPQLSEREAERAAAQLRAVESELMAPRGRLLRQVDLLIEHRQALITAAVTGELDIPGAAA